MPTSHARCRMVLALWLGANALLAQGCAVASHRPVVPAEYARSHRVYDLTFGWNTAVGDGRLQIDGYARNTRYFLLRDLTITVSLMGADGTVRGREMAFAGPTELRQDEPAHFEVTLQAVPRPGDTLRFHYGYRAIEGNDESFFWMNSFQLPLLWE